MKLGEGFLEALELLVRERNLSTEIIFSSVEAALALAYRKFKETRMDPVVTIDRATGEVLIYDVCRVVEGEAGISEIGLAEARALAGDEVQIGDTVKVPVLEHPEKFGRIAAQTARQVITQRLKDAEREIVYNEFNDKIGELVSNVLQSPSLKRSSELNLLEANALEICSCCVLSTLTAKTLFSTKWACERED